MVEKETKPKITKSVANGFSWDIVTFIIDGHKYIYFNTRHGVAICSAKED